MIDRDEFLRFRVANFLDIEHAELKEVSTGIGSLVVRQVERSGFSLGAFAPTQQAYRVGNIHCFLETPVWGTEFSRQLWLPAAQWEGYGTLSQREIVTTRAEPIRRFAAWQDIQPTIYDLEGYSKYNEASKALFDEAKMILQFMGANDENFRFKVEDES